MIKEFLNFARFAGPNMTVSKSFGDKRISLRKNLNGFYTINVYDTSRPMTPDYPALYTTTGISEADYSHGQARGVLITKFSL